MIRDVIFELSRQISIAPARRAIYIGLMSIRLAFTRVARLYCPGTLSTADRMWQSLMALSMMWAGYGLGVQNTLPPGQFSRSLSCGFFAMIAVAVLYQLTKWLAAHPPGAGNVGAKNVTS